MLSILENEPLSKYTTFRLGGPAKFFVVAGSVEELKEAFAWAKEKNQKYFIIGGGSNLLFSDAGFDGLVIKLAIKNLEISGNKLAAGAGAPLFLAIKKAADAGLAGLENMAGIPGTVGGAVAGNAGAYGTSAGDMLDLAEIIYPDGKIETVKKDWFNFAYRASRLKHWTGPEKPIVLSAVFDLKPGSAGEIADKMLEIIKTRAVKEPKGYCAGCIFKNIKGEAVGPLLERHNFSPDEKNLFGSRKAIPTAWFIERAELKGKKIGGAYIPEGHANYIMNDGTSKADDVITLISLVKQQVRDKFGVQLEEEVEIII